MLSVGWARWLIVAAVGLAAGCGDDSTTPALTGEGGTEPGTATATEGPEQDSDNSDPTASPTTGATGQGDTDDDEGGAAPGDGCGELDCGPGQCIEDELGVAQCQCDGNYHSIGYACIECTRRGTGDGLTQGTRFDVDVPAVDVVVEVTIGAERPPASVYHDGNLYLRNAATGDQVHLGNTHDESLIATIVPGVYDIYYAHENGTAVPLNRSAFIGRQRLDNDNVEQIDIPVAEIRLTTTLAGEQPPQSDYHFGELFLVSPSGDEVKLQRTNADEAQTHLVVPGDYHVHYRHVTGEAVPLNEDARVAAVYVEPRIEGVQEFAIDIPAVEAAGAITLAGEMPPTSDYHHGVISLQDWVTGDEFPIGDTRDGAYSALIVPGDYNVIYGRTTGTAVPVNERAHLRDAPTSFRGDNTALDVPAVTVSGNVTFNGAPPPTSASDDGIVSLKDATTGDIVVLGNTQESSYSAMVVPGTYDVYYSQETAGALAPANTNHRVHSGVAVTGAALDIDIETVFVSGTITLNGEAPPTSEFEDGRLYLRDAETGDSVLLGNTRLESFGAVAIPGVYEIIYVAENASAQAPMNNAAKIGEVELPPPPDWTIDIPSVAIQGDFTVDGSAADALDPGLDFGLFYLVDVRSQDRILIGRTDDAAYDMPFAAGRYLTVFESKRSDGGAPANLSATLACVDIVAD